MENDVDGYVWGWRKSRDRESVRFVDEGWVREMYFSMGL